MTNIKIGDRVVWNTNNIPGRGIYREGVVFGVDRENEVFDAKMANGRTVWGWLDHVTAINNEKVAGAK